MDAKREAIDGPETLGEIWRHYLATKFSATELEKVRKEYEALEEVNIKEQDRRQRNFLRQYNI